MKLFYAPGACSLGIHALLEEIGAPYALEAVDLRKGQQLAPGYRAVNAKGKVPALLRDDGTVLTEFQAIAFWLGRTHGKSGLLPADADGQARVLELLDFMIGTVHMRGFTLLIMPMKFVTDDSARQELEAHGRRVAAEGLAHLSTVLGAQPFVTGDLSIADFALLFLSRWALEFDVPLPPNLQAHLARMAERPSVARALADEGLSMRAPAHR